MASRLYFSLMLLYLSLMGGAIPFTDLWCERMWAADSTYFDRREEPARPDPWGYE